MRFIFSVLFLLVLSGCEPGEIEHRCDSPWDCPVPEPRPAEHRPCDGGIDSLEEDGGQKCG